MSGQISQGGSAVNKTSTGAVTANPCTLIGFYVNSTTSGTLVIKDGTASTGAAISGTITPAIGFHCFPASCSIGLYVTIANTLDVTFFYQPG